MSTFVFSLEIEISEKQKQKQFMEHTLFEVARQVQNTCLGEVLKRIDQMKRTKEYQKTLKAYLENKEQISNTKDKKVLKTLNKEKYDLQQRFLELRQLFKISEYDIHSYAAGIKYHFQNVLDINTTQKAATRAFKASEKLLYGKAKRVHFIKFGEVESIEGKDNKMGIMYKFDYLKPQKESIRLINKKIKKEKDPSKVLFYHQKLKSKKMHSFIQYGNHQMMLKTKTNDLYAQETLSLIECGELKVKYVRIKREYIRSKVRFFAQLVLEGTPVPKRNKDGTFKIKLGSGPIGADIGTQSVAVVANNKVILTNLAQKINWDEKRLCRQQRKMSRSLRLNNLAKFKEDGSIDKQNKDPWIKSKRYKKLQEKVRNLHRKNRVNRKTSHGELVNQIVALGDTIYTETANYKALQKRSSKTEKNDKGKFKKKKRFGKSVGNRAPGQFHALLKQKIERLGGIFIEVNTHSFKASQFDHVASVYIKKKLSQRWHVFADGVRVQRDMYSAFLLQHANPDGSKTNADSCKKDFDAFYKLHEKEIARIYDSGIKIKNSGIKVG